MNAHHIVSAFVTLSLATGVSPVWARQDPASVRDGPVSITALGGASLGSGQAGAAAGLTLSVDVHQRVSLEARSVYFDRGPGLSAMDLNVSVLVDLLTARRAVPYVSIGGGLYRAMFDVGNERSFGMMGASSARMTWASRMGRCRCSTRGAWAVSTLLAMALGTCRDSPTPP